MSHRKTPQSDTKAFHAAERRVQLNLAIANIDRGNLALARSLLEDLEYSSRHIRRSTPSRLINYARGYTALCDHLGGSLERAIRGYRQVLDTFVANRELRAVSIFNRHLGDLYARTGELTLADNHLQHAVNAASQAEQRDVQYLAIASQASVLIDRDQLDKARGFTERVSRYARQMGLYRLEADALLVDAKLKTRRGENGAAAEAAANAVSICLKNGLRLRKVSSLVKYGAVQFARGESQLGRGVLEEAKREAEKLGYQIQAARAADILATV